MGRSGELSIGFAFFFMKINVYRPLIQLEACLKSPQVQVSHRIEGVVSEQERAYKV
jgi:hypothetical protein